MSDCVGVCECVCVSVLSVIAWAKKVVIGFSSLDCLCTGVGVAVVLIVWVSVGVGDCVGVCESVWVCVGKEGCDWVWQP